MTIKVTNGHGKRQRPYCHEKNKYDVTKEGKEKVERKPLKKEMRKVRYYHDIIDFDMANI